MLFGARQEGQGGESFHSFLRTGRGLPGKIKLRVEQQGGTVPPSSPSPAHPTLHPSSPGSSAAAAAYAAGASSLRRAVNGLGAGAAGQQAVPAAPIQGSSPGPPNPGSTPRSLSSAGSTSSSALNLSPGPAAATTSSNGMGSLVFNGGPLYPRPATAGAGITNGFHPFFLPDQPLQPYPHPLQQQQQQQQQQQHHHQQQPPLQPQHSQPQQPALVSHPSAGSSPSTRSHSSSGTPPSLPGSSSKRSLASSQVLGHRLEKFHRLLSAPQIDLAALRELSWSGIPHHLRPDCWRLLVGYAPADRSQEAKVLKEQRAKYTRMIPELYDRPDSERTEADRAALRQVIVDAPRTAPHVPFFHFASVQKSLERVLYIWGANHPESGYVQGMNDLVTPFYTVFLSEHLSNDMDTWQPDFLPMNVMLDVEADCYWCLCKLIHGIQDQYTYAQPGIQRAVFKIHELIGLVDKELAAKMEAEEVDYIQFAWRWINCLLLRELPFRLSLRLWDTYLAEDARMCEFLIYACGSFLVQWSKELMNMDFQEMIMFLQKPPTAGWDETMLEIVLSRAFMWLNIWDGSALRQPMRPEHYIHGSPPPEKLKK